MIPGSASDTRTWLSELKFTQFESITLGSTSLTANADGTYHSEVRYSAFGEVRYDSGTMTTDYLYTGQRQEAEVGLYYYVARWYDPAIGRFIQADSVVPNPGSAKGFDRYSYGYNNPLMHVDPSGHSPVLLDGEQYAETDKSQGFNSYISATDRGEYADNANNWKPLSGDDKQVPFWGHDPDKGDGTDLLEGTHGNNTEDYYTDAELYGLIATGIVVEIGFLAAEVSLIVLQIELAGTGLPGVAFDVFVITPIEILILDVGLGVAQYIYEAGQTRQKPEFELTIFPMIFDLFKNEEKKYEGSHE